MQQTYRVLNKQKHGNDIPVRKMEWKFNNLDHHWFNNSIFQTYMMNVLSVLFPEGERLFIRSVQAFDKDIADPRLREEIKAFCGQEVQHGQAHDKLNQELAQIHRLGPISRAFHALVFDGFEGTIRRFGEKSKIMLAATAAAEHFTAAWAAQLFKSIDGMQLDDNVKRLILWHALEEIEHKNVAYDVFEQVSGDYTTRVGTMLFATVFIGVLMAATLAYFPFTDQEFNLRQYLGEIYDDLTNAGGEEGFSFTHLTARAVVSYLRPSFHPDDVDELTGALEKFQLHFDAA